MTGAEDVGRSFGSSESLPTKGGDGCMCAAKLSEARGRCQVVVAPSLVIAPADAIRRKVHHPFHHQFTANGCTAHSERVRVYAFTPDQKHEEEAWIIGIGWHNHWHCEAVDMWLSVFLTR